MLTLEKTPNWLWWYDNTNYKLRLLAWWFRLMSSVHTATAKMIPLRLVETIWFWVFISPVTGLAMLATAHVVPYWIILMFPLYMAIVTMAHHAAQSERDLAQEKLRGSAAMWPGDLAWTALNRHLGSLGRELDWVVNSPNPAVHEAIKAYLDRTIKLRREIQATPTHGDEHPLMGHLRRAAHRAAIAISTTH